MTQTTMEPTTEANLVPPAPKQESAAQKFFRSKRLQASITFLAFIVIFVVMGLVLGSSFANVDSRMLNIHQNVPLLLLGLAGTITLVAGKFDLSVASMATLTAFLAVGLRVNQGLDMWLVLVICLVVGVAGGLVNGLLVERLNMNAFIATLGTGTVFAGISSVFAKGAAIIPKSDSPQIAEWFTQLGSFMVKPPVWVTIVFLVVVVVFAFYIMQRMKPRRMKRNGWMVLSAVIVLASVGILLLIGLWTWLRAASWLVGLLLVVSIVMWIVLDLTVLGRSIKAVGSNASAAALAGVKTSSVVIRAFMIGGVLSALAGVIIASTQGSVSPDIAAAYLLPAFSAAFLSTVMFSNGRFTIWGTIIGGIFLAWAGQGLIVAGVPATWTNIVNGGLLLLAVALSTIMRRFNR